MENLNIGFAITGSFCTYEQVFTELKNLADMKANIYPIFSYNSAKINSKFGNSIDFLQRAKLITGKEVITSIEDAEPFGPSNMLDLLIIAPCTGNTLAKLANGITDTPVLMAAKAHLRNDKALVISLSTNDALGINFKNLGLLMNSKNIYFVPFGQDNYTNKPKSMVSHTNLIIPTIKSALKGRQYQPILLDHLHK